MTSEQLDKLGEYFVYFNIHNRYGIPFEHFIHLVSNGVWEEWQKTS